MSKSLTTRISEDDQSLTILDREAYNNDYENTQKYLEEQGCPDCGDDGDFYMNDSGYIACLNCSRCDF